jgi:acetylglutamate kinase
MNEPFSGKTFVLRVDDDSVRAPGSTFVDDLQVLTDGAVRPIVVAPNPDTARAIVRTINRRSNAAVALSGSDAALLPQSQSGGIGNVQPALLHTLTGAGYIPVIEPTAFSAFRSNDAHVAADEVACAIATSVDAVRAIFFHCAGGVADPKTQELIDELTPAEALELADDPSMPPGLRAAMVAAARGVRGGVAAAQIVDGRVAHAAIVEFITARHVGTQVTGSIYFAA